MFDLDELGRFRSGPYAGWRPDDPAVQLLASIDASASALGLLGGPALPFGDVVDVSPTAFGPIAFPGVGIDPLASQLLLPPLRTGDPLTLAATLPAVAALTEEVVRLSPPPVYTCGGGPLAGLCQASIAQCGNGLDPFSVACRDNFNRGLAASSSLGGDPVTTFPDLTSLGFLPFPSGGVGPAGTPPGPSQPEGFFGGLLSTIAATLPSIVNTVGSLAQAGVIRGSVGEFFAPQQGAMMMNPVLPTAVGMSPVGFVPAAGSLGSILSTLGSAAMGSPTVAGAMGGMAALGVDQLLSLLGGGGTSAGCGVRRPPMQIPQLFRTNACGRVSLPSRQQVIGPDGQLYIIASLGRAVRGASEARVMRRLARDNGFTVARRGSGRGRARRRPR